jgi:hypothetical protein
MQQPNAVTASYRAGWREIPCKESSCAEKSVRVVLTRQYPSLRSGCGKKSFEITKEPAYIVGVKSVERRREFAFSLDVNRTCKVVFRG